MCICVTVTIRIVLACSEVPAIIKPMCFDTQEGPVWRQLMTDSLGGFDLSGGGATQERRKQAADSRCETHVEELGLMQF